MKEFRADTYCGLYCGACDMQMAHRRALEAGVEPTWDGVHFPLKKHFASAPVVCCGCKSDEVFRGCQVCPIRKCARTMPEIETCLDCRKYPCFRHTMVRLVRWAAGMNRKLPHLSVIPGNLQAIRERGLAAWLEEQRKQWTCPSCGAAFSWYQPTCSGCGRDLRDLKSFRCAPPAK